MSDVRTLGEIGARISMLQIACSRCEQRGRYRLQTLSARDGAEAGVRVVVRELTPGCPQRESAALVERRGVLFPALPAPVRAR